MWIDVVWLVARIRGLGRGKLTLPEQDADQLLELTYGSAISEYRRLLLPILRCFGLRGRDSA